MTRLILPYLVFVFAARNIRAQEENSFSAGLLFSPTISASTIIHNSASVFIRSNKNEYLMAVDFYLNKIRGLGCGYRHHFLNDKKKNHWYGELNLRYVKYGSGFMDDAPINYFEPFIRCDKNTYDLVNENSVLSGALSIGREFFLSKMFQINISIGGGAYRKRKELLECWKPLYGNPSEEGIHPEADFKVGFGINVYRKVKQ